MIKLQIIEYNSKYDEQIKTLLVELQEYIAQIDKEGYNIITEYFKELYFQKTMEEINSCNGKIFLASQNEKIVGLIIGVVNNEEENSYDFKAPKRGRITELIVSQKYRTSGIGQILLNKMEEYLKNIGCKAILIECFGYNTNALKFYQKNGYFNRAIEMTKKL